MNPPTSSNNRHKLRIAIVVPHIFMHQDILPHVIFAPGQLAISLANKLTDFSHEVTLFTPGPVLTKAHNVSADLSLFEDELAKRSDSYLDLLRKHPMTFISLARQVQSEIVDLVYSMANKDQFDIVHIYTNEEEIAMVFANICKKPVIFTHHDPFNFLIKYKSIMPKYKHLNWVSLSYSQRQSMPNDTNWVGNVYNGIDDVGLQPTNTPSNDYFAYIGRIIQPKGVHLAIKAVNKFNKTALAPIKLKIAGKHYSGDNKDEYWQKKIRPEIKNNIEYVGFIDSLESKQQFLSNARALLVPSLFDEPFGVVTAEAFACGTPVVALDSGALPEIIEENETGFIIKKGTKPIDEGAIIQELVDSLHRIGDLDRKKCYQSYKDQFTSHKMAKSYEEIYYSLTQ